MSIPVKKLSGLLLAAVLVLSCLALCAPSAQAEGSFTLVGGWHESLYAEIDGIEDAE